MNMAVTVKRALALRLTSTLVLLALFQSATGASDWCRERGANGDRGRVLCNVSGKNNFFCGIEYVIDSSATVITRNQYCIENKTDVELGTTCKEDNAQNVTCTTICHGDECNRDPPTTYKPNDSIRRCLSCPNCNLEASYSSMDCRGKRVVYLLKGKLTVEKPLCYISTTRDNLGNFKTYSRGCYNGLRTSDDNFCIHNDKTKEETCTTFCEGIDCNKDKIEAHTGGSGSLSHLSLFLFTSLILVHAVYGKVFD